MRWMILVVILVQVADALLHIVTGNAEPVRIASNAIMAIAALGALQRGRAGWIVPAAGLGAYAVLNGAFVAVAGLVGPDGAVRIALLAFVVLTLAFGLILVARARRRPQNP